jgi:transcriptional regulator with XRE-family HTH domain
VGRRIRDLRVERGITQEKLALDSGVTRPILNSVENGRRGILFERLYDIAEALGVPASELMAESS